MEINTNTPALALADRIESWGHKLPTWKPARANAAETFATRIVTALTAVVR